MQTGPFVAFVCFCAFDGSEICLPNRIFSNFSMDTGDPEISTHGITNFTNLSWCHQEGHAEFLKSWRHEWDERFLEVPSPKCIGGTSNKISSGLLRQ